MKGLSSILSTQAVIIILGIISSGTLLISALSVHRQRLLAFSILTGLLVVFEYGLTGAWSGLLSVGIGLVWTLINVFTARYTVLSHPLLVPIFILFQAIAFIVSAHWNDLNILSFIPLFGGIGGVIGVYLKEVLHMKTIFIICGVGWLGYEFSAGIYGQMIGESINLVANVVAFFALLSARRNGVPEIAMQNLDIQFIETLTGAIHLPSHTKPLPIINYDLYPKATLRGNKKPIRGAHAQSVGYARLSAEYDVTRNKMRDDLIRKFAEMDEITENKVEHNEKPMTGSLKR